MHCRRRTAISSAGQLPVPAALDTHFPTLPDVDGDSIHPLPGICNGVRRENCGGVEPRTYGGVQGVREKNPPVTALPCQPPLGKGAEGTGMRIARARCALAMTLLLQEGRYGIGGRTGASAPTEAQQEVQWAGDRKGRPYGGFTRSAYMRAVGDAGPYGGVSCGAQGSLFCIEKTTVRRRSFFIEDFTQPWEPRARQPERPQRQPWQQRPSSRRQPSAQP